MTPNEELKPVAENVTDATKKGEAVPLDQPFPDELTQPPAPHEDANEPQPASDASEQKEILSPPEDDEKPTLVAGYKARDLLEAPLQPPKPVKTEGSHATHNTSVVFTMAIGIVLVAVGLVIALAFNLLAGFIIMLLGGIAVIAGVFVPFRV